MIDAIAFKYRTGTPWMNLPEHFGSWKVPITGCGSEPPTAPGKKSPPPSSLRPTLKATSTGSSRQTPRLPDFTSMPPGPVKGAPAREQSDHALGRSCGGLTTKIHLAADGRCRRLAFSRYATGPPDGLRDTGRTRHGQAYAVVARMLGGRGPLVLCHGMPPVRLRLRVEPGQRMADGDDHGPHSIQARRTDLLLLPPHEPRAAGRGDQSDEPAGDVLQGQVKSTYSDFHEWTRTGDGYG
ncbi:hypothetical protein GCM10019017_22820 [Streptomyces showdoensis]